MDMASIKENLIYLVSHIKGIPKDRQKNICSLLADKQTHIPNTLKHKKEVNQFAVLLCTYFSGILQQKNLKINKNLLENFSKRTELEFAAKTNQKPKQKHS